MKFLTCALLLITLLPTTSSGQTAGSPAWNRDVRPILAANCFECHGPDEQTREADLRFDVRDAAVVDRGGYAAIVPGNPGESELIARITSDDESLVMPPVDSNRSLTPGQKEILRRWVEAGAEYEPHWSFVPPVQPSIPDAHSIRDAEWVRNEIDRFVLARLESEGLQPSPEADPYTLVRRVYLDLIGLPPTPEQADAFAGSSDPLAYEQLVDELLQSPHYGERWARQWLDLARYADTNGYEKDRERSIWPYRDWVIDALNNDMPFDQFTIEQLAGDMLPDATLAQRIATGFHRNTMINEEGGIDPLEYRYYAMVDRVATTGTVWMGLTIGCAQCHTHKFDPITHTDYYSMMALLDNADEPDLLVPDQTVAGRRAEIEGQIDQLIAELPEQFPPLDGEGPEEQRRQENLDQQFEAWRDKMRNAIVDWHIVRPTQMETNLPRLEVLDDGSIFSTGDITKRDVFNLKFEISDLKSQITAIRLEVLPDDRLPAGGPGRAYYEGRKGDFFLSEVSATHDDAPVQFVEPSRSFGKISVGAGTADAANVIDGNGDTGWSTSTREGERHTLVLNLAEPIDTPATLDVRMLFERHFAAGLGRFRLAVTTDGRTAKAVDLPLEVEQIFAQDESTWSPEQSDAVRREFLLSTPQLAEARKPIDKLRKRMPDPVTTMVLQERPADNRRATHLHHRGEYLQTREEVTPAVPELFPAIPDSASADRLSFARWLVSDANPLVGRVTVNRAWQAFFGRGLVATSADFGTQGELPSHPELLDWLAVEFVARGWSMKQLHRLIVTSATYRQSSHVSPVLLQRDPQNVLLARGPRFRVNAETVRDIGLLASGLLSPKVGGPSVYPPQPASVTALAYGSTPWKPSEGEDRYRRSLYTFSKRTAPFAAYAVFDAPTGESCIARRERSNTALQALTMLNDPMFLEMAEALAAEAVSRETVSAESVSRETDPGSDSERSSAEGTTVGDAVSRETLAANRATFIVRRCLTRPPTDDELQALTSFAADQQQRFETGELDSTKVCTSHPPSAELAAWTMVARAVLNLDETITKP